MDNIKSNPVHFLDTTLRDGAQALPEHQQFTAEAKINTAETLAAIGIETIEAGFAQTEGDKEIIEEIAKTVGRSVLATENSDNTMREIIPSKVIQPIITGLALSTKWSIAQTWDAVQYADKPGIHLFVATDSEHMKIKHPNMTPDMIADMASDHVVFAKEISEGKARIQFSAEAATTSNLDFLDQVIGKVLQSGADVINLPDTMGRSWPEDIKRVFSRITSRIIQEGLQDDVAISTHNHNDLGYATANTVAAVKEIIERAKAWQVNTPLIQVETTIAGIGERAGNAQMSTVAANIEKSDFAHHNLNSSWFKKAAYSIATEIDYDIHPKTPIIGSDIAIHRSGVHSDAIIKGGAKLYSAFDATKFGHTESGYIQDGKYQGRNGQKNLGSVEY